MSRIFSSLLPALLSLASACQSAEKWPSEVKEVRYLSAADNTQQPALFYAPTGNRPQPLLVALHTWSGDYRQPESIPYARWCLARNWAFIHPDFRGPNLRPEATGSELVVKDVLSAVTYAKGRAAIDQTRIYLVGVSGGGHLALLLAGRAPDVWAGVSAWVPISDLNAWYAESKAAGRRYAQDIAQSCGGAPEADNAAARECRKRSPLTYLAGARKLALDINAGITDGHTGSVPISHSLRAFNLLADEAARLTEAQIAEFFSAAKVPASAASNAPLTTAGKKRVLFRRQAGQTRLTIFDGGHEIDFEAALDWLSHQQKTNSSKPEER
jgi:dienelactone hydrolase